MRAVSLWQPWASLIAIGAKRYETRGWQHHYRGPLVIHAAKRWHNGDQARLLTREPFATVLAPLLARGPLPRGVALCVVDLVRVVPVEAVLPTLPEQERAFGDFSPGRWAWELANVRPFPRPLPCRGFQSVFDIPDHLVEEALRGQAQ